MDRGAWRATVHRVTESQTQLVTEQQRALIASAERGTADLHFPRPVSSRHPHKTPYTHRSRRIRDFSSPSLKKSNNQYTHSFHI